jgi:hypothetical protein
MNHIFNAALNLKSWKLAKQRDWLRAPLQKSYLDINECGGIDEYRN